MTRAHEDDILLAEFMEMKRVWGVKDAELLKRTYPASEIRKYEKEGYRTILQFRHSYEWLMPVVNKVQNLPNADQTEFYGQLANSLFEYDSEETARLCAEIVRWHIKSKKP